MSKHLPYKATTAGGQTLEFDFPLHAETESAVNVANLMGVVLATLDREIAQVGPISNGDLLQALAMTLAVRTRSIPGDPDMLARLARDLTDRALDANWRTEHASRPSDSRSDLH